LSGTRAFNGISLKIILVLALWAVVLPVVLSGAVCGTGAAWPARTAGQSARLTRVAGPAVARLSSSVSQASVIRVVSGSAVSGSPGAASLAATAALHYRTPQQIARSLLRRFHWSRWQFWFLNQLWAKESGWDRYASNPDSGAYGIPQALPGSKMASSGPGWQSNERTQILWGMHYIEGRYRTPYRAWLRERLSGWY
jgi:hypothetical protein